MRFGVRSPLAKNSGSSNRMRTIERRIALGVAIFILSLVSYLVVFAQPLIGAAVAWVNSLLALCIAVLAGTLSGEITVDGKVVGMGTRAGGALGVFVLVFVCLQFGIPKIKISPQAKLDFARITSVDIRSFNDPNTFNKNHGAGPIAFTFPISVSASSPFSLEDMQPATIKSAELAFTLDGKKFSAPWLWFVTHNFQTLPESTWLSTTLPQDVKQMPVTPGAPLFREVLFQIDGASLTWRELIEKIGRGICPKDVHVAFETVQEGKPVALKQSCEISCIDWQKQIERIISSGGLPSRIGTSCLG